jgi:S1-C subfamily serine protease
MRALSTLFLALLLLAPGGSALAAKKAPAPDSVTDATVNLYCRLKAGKKTYSASGSGVFVGDRGVILTNAHVAQYFLLAEDKGAVRGWCSVRTGSPAKDRYTAAVLYIPPTWAAENASALKKRQPKGSGENDFALLYVTGAKKGTLPASFPALSVEQAAAVGEAVTLAGYPTEKLDFDQIRAKLKLVQADSTITDIGGYTTGASDVLTIASSKAGSQGVSGGPVANAADKLLGIVTTKSTKKDDRTVRAISVSYIARSIELQTGFPFSSFLTGDFASRAFITLALLPSDTIDTIRSGFLKK